MKRLLPLIALAALLVGCGSAASTGSGGGDGASVVPASVAAWASIDTDLSSSQLKTADALLSKFPARDKLLSQLRKSIESDGVSWENDVKPALGPELDIAVLGVDSQDDVVALTQPQDDSKLQALVRKLNASDTSGGGGGKAVTGTVDGWTVIAHSQDQIDRFKRDSASGTLADLPKFQSAMDAISGDALAKAYVDGAKVGPKLRESMNASGQVASPALKPLLDLQSGVAELVARDDGLQLKGDVKSSGKSSVASYTPKLLAVVPAGALAVVSFRGTGSAPAAGQQMPAVPGLAPLLGALKQLAPIFSGESVLYVVPGFPIPAVTLLGQPKDAAAGAAAVDRLVKSLAPLLGRATIRETSLDGVAAREVDFGRFTIYYGTTGGRVFVSSSQRVVAQLRAGGQKIADDSTFKEAKKAAGMGDTTSGFVYVNLKDAVPLAEMAAQLGGSKLPSDVDENLRHLRTLFVYGDGGSGESRFSAFLGVG